jgi:SAM-dependent methyltransferase
MFRIFKTAPEKSAQKASQFWSELQTTKLGPGYWNHPYLAISTHAKTEGKWMMEYFRDKYMNGNPSPSALSIGCGAGEVDRIAYEKGIFRQLCGMDFSESGIKLAQESASRGKLPFSYFHVDLNQNPIPGNDKYDLIYAYATLHHIHNLEQLVASINDHLKHDGYFLLYEYCGPARLQWSNRVMEIGNSLMRRIPMRLRTTLPELRRPALSEFLAGDPSEAVRGYEIIDVVKAILNVVEEVDLGWTLTCPMFYQNAHLLNPDNDADQAIFRMICEFESILIEEGVIGSDGKLVVAKRR